MILDKLRAAYLAAAAALALGACSGQAPGREPTVTFADANLPVSCSISTLCSLVASVGGDRVIATTIVPVGASPETYEPTPADVRAIARARVVFENGVGLETWLRKLIGEAGSSGQTTVVLSDAIDEATKSSGNPHLWMDPILASAYVTSIEKSLTAVEPRYATVFHANATAERARLARLDEWIHAQIATIPPEHRAMICFHDAWYYFDRRYGLLDVGAIEPSPGQEPSAGSFARLIVLARAHHVRAVFGEPQYSPKLAAALQSSAGIELLSNLYDDTLGTTPGLSTYEDMMRYDVSEIVKALRP